MRALLIWLALALAACGPLPAAPTPVPALPPTAAPTEQPTPPPTEQPTEQPTPPPTEQPAGRPPQILAIRGVAQGDTLIGTAVIEASVAGAVDRVEFELTGPTSARHTERRSPYLLFSDDDGVPRGWDTAAFADGGYQLTVTAVGPGGATASATVSFSVANGAASAADIARHVAGEAGELSVTAAGDGGRRVIVLAERHGSRAGQIELAMVLNRLYHEFGLRDLALEGLTAERGAPDTAWAAALPDALARRDMALGMLAGGEIGAAEFMAIAYPDVRLRPAEAEAEYAADTEPDPADLLRLADAALASPLPDDRRRALAQADAPVREALGRGAAPQACDAARLADLLDQLAQAGQPDLGAAAALRPPFAAGCARSATMADSAAALAEAAAPPTTVALDIGAAHVDDVVARLRARGISVAVVAPLSLAGRGGDLSPPAMERMRRQLSVEPAGTLGALLDSRRRPRPCIEAAWCRADARVRYAAIVLARAAAAGGDPPFGLDPTALGLPGADLARAAADRQPGQSPAALVPVLVPEAGGEIWLRAQQVPPLFSAGGRRAQDPDPAAWEQPLDAALRALRAAAQAEPAWDEASARAAEARFSDADPAPVRIAPDVELRAARGRASLTPALAP